MTELIPDTLTNLAVPIDGLVPYGKNPRRGNVDVIVESLKLHGQYRPVVVRAGTNEVLAGNHTVAAARQLGWQKIAATFIDVDDDKAARIVLIDNRANDLATYDDEILAEVLDSLPDLEGTGFEQSDLDQLLAGILDEDAVALTGDDDVPDLPTEPRSKEGDVWLLGPHRVLCGDSTDASLVWDALDGTLADVIWTDPPYGVDYVGGTKDKLTIQNDGADDLPELLLGAFNTIAAVSKPGAPIYVAHADTARTTFEQAMVDAGLVVRQNLIWVKTSLVMGRSDYHYRHEPILMGEVPEPDGGPTTHDGVLYGFTPDGEGRLGRGGRRWFGDNKQTTVFEVPKPARNDVHPTMKPVDLIRIMLKNSLRPRGLVLDLFGGSGSTLIAAHHHGSSAALVELDPKYVDVICRRWQEHTGVKPILKATGETVDFLEAA